MSSLEEIFNTKLTHYSDNVSSRILREEFPPLYKQVSDFLINHGFDDIELCTKGSKSLVFNDKKNKDFVIRISNDTREVVPQIIQPFYKKSFGSLNIEFVQNLGFDTPESLDAVRRFGGSIGLVKPYKQELESCGYTLFSDFPHMDLGVFGYTDPTGKKRFVPMGVDADMVQRKWDDTIPKCTENYPTLEDQWKEQCRIVDGDDRLRKLVGVPEKLPDTQVIRSPAEGLAL